MKIKCKKCEDELITNTANNKEFYYCRVCKDEKTSWGYELPKLEEPPKDLPKSTNSEADEFWKGYSGDPGIGQTLTQQEIDELFQDMYSGDIS